MLLFPKEDLQNSQGSEKSCDDHNLDFIYIWLCCAYVTVLIHDSFGFNDEHQQRKPLVTHSPVPLLIDTQLLRCKCRFDNWLPTAICLLNRHKFENTCSLWNMHFRVHKQTKIIFYYIFSEHNLSEWLFYIIILMFCVWMGNMWICCVYKCKPFIFVMHIDSSLWCVYSRNSFSLPLK